jgi:hypothetical protein
MKACLINFNLKSVESVKGHEVRKASSIDYVFSEQQDIVFVTCSTKKERHDICEKAVGADYAGKLVFLSPTTEGLYELMLGTTGYSQDELYKVSTSKRKFELISSAAILKL